MGEEHVLVELHAPARATGTRSSPPTISGTAVVSSSRQGTSSTHARGSFPATKGARSATTPASPVGEPWESVTSDQPTSPSSVVALTKSHGLQPASQVTVSRRASFTPGEDIRGRAGHSAAGSASQADGET